MLTTARLVLVVVTLASASASAAAGPALPAIPVMPLVVGITASADLSPALVALIVEESDAIWRAAGFRFVWQHDARSVNANLRVMIGGGMPAVVDRQMPLAWINVAADGVPDPKIYVSYTNAQRFMEASRDTVGLVSAMPRLQRDTYLARVMGRALAHEVGHYLMGSKLHAAKGLMRASHTSVEFFSVERGNFKIEAHERQRMAARFTSIYMASRG